MKNIIFEYADGESKVGEGAGSLDKTMDGFLSYMEEEGDFGWTGKMLRQKVRIFAERESQETVQYVYNKNGGKKWKKNFAMTTYLCLKPQAEN